MLIYYRNFIEDYYNILKNILKNNQINGKLFYAGRSISIKLLKKDKKKNKNGRA